jgi:ribosomal protein S18 acetylase RimI-like enzyme
VPVFRTATDQLRVRPLEPDDLDAAADLSAAAFGHSLDDEPARRSWTERVAHPFRTDPEGAFVAEHGGQLVGLTEAIRRERLWVLSMLAVEPGIQSAGAGRALLERALRYGVDCNAGLICCSSDPRALRLYALAGFSLRPTFEAKGRLDRRALPPADPEVSEVDPADLEALEALAPISRAVRGGPHTSELLFGLNRGARVLRYRDRGFAVSQPGLSVWLLAARDEAAAEALLWSALELVGEAKEDRPTARWITGEQDWAIRVLLKAGYALAPRGALCVRGRPGPLHPFLPTPPFA